MLKLPSVYRRTLLLLSILQILHVQYVCGFTVVQQHAALQLFQRSLLVEDDSRSSQCRFLQHPVVHSLCYRSTACSPSQLMGKKENMFNNWLPSSFSRKTEDGIQVVNDDEERKNVEQRSIRYLAHLMKVRLRELKEDKESSELGDGARNEDKKNGGTIDQGSPGAQLAKGRFEDLTCTEEGEKILENLFSTELDDDDDLEIKDPDEDTIRGAVIALQSLIILGTQVGVKGSVYQQKRLVSHLSDNADKIVFDMDMDSFWNQQSMRQLKHRVDTTAGMQLLAYFKRKRSSQSAADLLVELGVWTKHEDLALLRSGFPIRFSDKEAAASQEAEKITHDPDAVLGLRQDLRHLKVYTIDGDFTTEIDDGLSIETIIMPDGSVSPRKRIWIHIADADRWSPRNSDVFQAAQRRATSLYLPMGPIQMFPHSLGSGVMSLRENYDSHALSLAVELNEDGSIDLDSLQITPSLINVNYRLTYDEVDEMFDHGIAYFEEWELGALLAEAHTRRMFRITNGSVEGFVTQPIPQNEIRVAHDENAQDQLEIFIKVFVTHNAGFNQSSIVTDGNPSKAAKYAVSVSPAFLLVTEMMILAGEAMGKLGEFLPSKESDFSGSNNVLENQLNLPYRTQAKRNFAQRHKEFQTLQSLKNNEYDEYGYCHAWYARRFLDPIKITPDPQIHSGLGLDSYVQWTSPIRRFGDLQVHAAVKRFLRKSRINDLMQNGQAIPSALTSSDLGCPVPVGLENSKDAAGKYTEYLKNDGTERVDEIDFKRGIGFLLAARNVQSKSKLYWIIEYLRRKKDSNTTEETYEALVIGCVDPRRFQYAIYVPELGLEHRYLSEMGSLQIGETIMLKAVKASPWQGLLTFGLAKK